MPSRIVWYNSNLMGIASKELTYRKGLFEALSADKPYVDSLGVVKELDNLSTAYIMNKDFRQVKPNTLSFAQAIQASVNRLVKLALKKNKKIRLYYSGGVDSVAILTALRLHPQYTDLRFNEGLELSMTSDSIKEFPEMYSKYIVKELPFHPVKLTGSPENHILSVSGAFGDQILSSVTFPNVMAKYGEGLSCRGDNIHIIYDLFSKVDPTGTTVEAIRRILAEAPMKITSAIKAMWWIELTQGAQDEMLDRVAYSDKSLSELLSEEDTLYRPFFQDEMLGYGYRKAEEFKGIDNYGLVKQEMKEFIVKHTGFTSYLDKRKSPSYVFIPKVYNKSVVFEDGTYLTNNVIDLAKYKTNESRKA